MIAGRWRAALAAAPRTHVVANADDPLVVWAAGAAPDVHWVGAGPALAARCRGLPVVRGAHRARRRHVGVHGAAASPGPRAEVCAGDGAGDGVDAGGVVRRAGATPSTSPCPAASTRPTRCMATVAAEACGVDAAAALDAMADGGEVAGRFTVRTFGDTRARLMLAKNPAGWDELLDLVAQDDGAVGREHQRAGGRRRGPELAVGRALRAPGRPPGRGDGRPLPRPLGAPAVRRGGPCDRGRPGGARWRWRWATAASATGGDADDASSTSSATTRPSTSCSGRRREPGGPLRVAVVFPDLLGTYGDGGNGLILARRAEWRGRESSCSRPPRTRRCPRRTSTASAAERTGRRCGRRAR